MIVEVKIPSPGESISEVELTRWLVKNGAIVSKDQEVAEIESEKASLPIIAPESGKINILVGQGSTVAVNAIACTIDTSVASRAEAKNTSVEPAPQVKDEVKPKETTPKTEVTVVEGNIKVTPLAKQIMADNNLSVDDIINGLRRITAHDVELVKNQSNQTISMPVQSRVSTERVEERTKMSQLRKKISERLVSVKNQTAMLTTFNEVDMSRVMEIRAKYQQEFKDKYGVKLGLMSFFTKAVVEALKLHPMTNSFIDGEEIVTPNYYDIGVAVQAPKGLMVPVLRNVESMSFSQIEQGIQELANKARSGKITLDELNGGTFTITNGGIFGSMLSTPILNPPQSGILGMHNIVDRPVAVNGKVEIRPIMYVALSYDHRIIDGKDSASFLMDIKRMIENPETIMFGGNNLDKTLIGL
ncbi:MAG: 2-oxoglutarate dehydrogenase complex dihydrolipoyllysine-residue succinyltransferase [Bacteroidales bacterium]|nr:MAG: 2-oxoglutarate dehydrogenase complex dihydrolipoyllysine-residue succinyltransferase [Bacteroidales bacterium]